MNGADRFLKACRRETVDRPPVWFMRQAGRSLPEYRELREKHGFLDMIQTPELAVTATLQPIDRFGMDGAILFSDILVIAPGMGLDVDFRPGPVLGSPVRTRADAEALRIPDIEESVGYVLQSLRLLREELGERAALIGFAGGPFTVASFLVEKPGGRERNRMRTWMRSDPAGADVLLEKITQVTTRYLRAQVAAGARAIQIFDTRAGVFGAPEFRSRLLPYVRRCVESVSGQVPVIYIALESSHLLEAATETGADVLSVDWRLPLDRVRERVGTGVALQGNLDPAALFAEPDRVAAECRKVLEAGATAPGHVFNLGHGVLPDTPLQGLEAAVETVQGWSCS